MISQKTSGEHKVVKRTERYNTILDGIERDIERKKRETNRRKRQKLYKLDIDRAVDNILSIIQ